VTLADGARAVLPLTFDARHDLLVGTPAGNYGGWLSQDPLEKRHAEALARHLVTAYPRLRCRVNPFHALQVDSAPTRAQPDHTRVLRLGQGMETLRQRFHRSHRRGLTRAQRAGLSVSLARDDEDWAMYYRCYEASLERWGERATSRYEPRLFEEIRRQAGPHARLWLARHEGEPVAGALLLHCEAHAAYWHGASRADHLHLRPVHLLMHELFAQCAAEGIELFDFNPSGGVAGVEQFKIGFGAEALSAPSLRVDQPRRMGRVMRRLRRAWR